MRLLYVCSDFGIAPCGTKGASIHLRAITRALCDLGHDVRLLSPKKAPGEEAQDGHADHPVRALLPGGCPPAEKTPRLLKHWLRDRGFSDSVARELRPLIYNAWVHEPALKALADHPPHAIVERLSLFGHVGIDLADALGVPLIVEVNAPLAEEARTFRSLQLTELADEIELRVLRRADAITAVSAPLADRLAEHVDREKLHVVPNGVDLPLFDGAAPRDACRKKLGWRDEFVVGFTGSLKEWHGVDLLMSAFAKLREDDASARLLIVGTGPVESRLREQAAKLKLDGAVVFTGAVEHARIPELLGAMDVAVAPFRRVDNFYFSPIKLFEYMASGTCVVASRLGQISEVIQHESNGLLCAPDDEHALYQVLEQARRSPDLRRRLGAQAQQAVRTRYTWANAAQATSTIIQSTIDRGDAHVGDATRDAEPASTRVAGEA